MRVLNLSKNKRKATFPKNDKTGAAVFNIAE